MKTDDFRAEMKMNKVDICYTQNLISGDFAYRGKVKYYTTSGLYDEELYNYVHSINETLAREFVMLNKGEKFHESSMNILMCILMMISRL